MDEEELFSYSKIAINYGILDLIEWFSKHGKFQFRFIVDKTADDENISLQERVSYYPGVKMIGIVTNPWARLAYSYNILKEELILNPNKFGNKLNTNSFEEYVLTMPYNEKVYDHLWFNFGTNQIEWLTYTDDDGNFKDIDFLLRAENLQEEFDKKIKSYLNDDKEFSIRLEYPNYKNLYSKEMKDKIEEVFYKDIEYYKYTF